MNNVGAPCNQEAIWLIFSAENDLDLVDLVLQNQSGLAVMIETVKVLIQDTDEILTTFFKATAVLLDCLKLAETNCELILCYELKHIFGWSLLKEFILGTLIRINEINTPFPSFLDNFLKTIKLAFSLL